MSSILEDRAMDASDQTVKSPLGDQLKLEEFKILRGEIELRSSEGRTMERNVMIISAVIYGFLLTPKSGDLSALDKIYVDQAWYLPPILNFLALVRWRESMTTIVALAAYLRGIETAHMGGKGREAYLECLRKKRTNPMISPWYTFFWIVIVVGPLAIGLLRHLGYDPRMLALTAAASILVGVVVYKILPKEEKQNASCCAAAGQAAGNLG
jgi:hypothetical protein